MKSFEIREGIIMAWQAIRANKLRSFLTILGVLIGVSSVIGMASIIQGLNNSMTAQIQSLGSNIIYISKNEPGIHLGRRSEEERKRKGITYEDALAIRKLCPSVGAVSPQNHYWAPGGNLARYRDNEARRPSFAGVLPDYEVVNNSFVTDGRFITDSDVHFKTYVCVIGKDVAEALFPNVDPIGKDIRVNEDRFTVVGLMEEKSAILGESRNNFVLIPYGTFQKLHPEEITLSLAVRPKSPELIDKTIDEIEQVMRLRRGVPADQPNDFAVTTQEDLMNTYRKITSAIYGVMVLISSIGLVVGGVGVMNIMLVTVTERTREIGIRKAIGARRRNILWQFLIEASTLSGLGGVVGIILGVAIGQLVKSVTPLPASVSLFWVILAFSVAITVGLVFGIYPAYRAARVDPIVSLRYE
jgi:putative ABC transport system permease protein